MIITPHLMISMLPTIIHDLDYQLNVRWSSHHFTSVISHSTLNLKTRMSRNIYHSKTQYIHVNCKFLSSESFTTHHCCATQPDSSNNFHQWEASHKMHHFSAIGSNYIGICLIRVNRHRPYSKNVNCTSSHQNHRLNWALIHIFQKAVKTERQQNSSSRVSCTTPLSRNSIIQRSSSALLRLSSSRPHCNAM